jgi:hypothetical protein
MMMKKLAQEEEDRKRKLEMEVKIGGIFGKLGKPVSGAPTVENAQNPQMYGEQDAMNELRGLGLPGLDAAAKFKETMPDKTKPMVVGKSLIDPSTGKIIATDSTWADDQEKDRAEKRYLAQLMLSGRQQPQPQIVQTDNGPMQVDRSGRAVPIIGPNGQPVMPKSTEKALPTSAAGRLLDNQENLRKAEHALALINGSAPSGSTAAGDQNATGWKSYMPEAMLQRFDPEGVDTRAAIGDLGSMIVHERSGASVTASESPRLRPFLPQTTDSQATVKKKLKRFVEEYTKINQETGDFYRESGYKVPVTNTERKSRGASGSWEEPATPNRRATDNLSAEEQTELNELRKRFGK